MELLGLVLLLHAVVIAGFVAARALYVRLAPLPAPAVVPAGDPGVGPSAVPTGRALEDYLEAGLVDLRIMLVQAARRQQD